MTLKAAHKLPILPIEHPYKVVFSSSDQDIAFRMPFEEVQILIWTILKNTLELEVIFNIPNANLVVHASSRHELPIMVELDVLHSLCMPWQMLM